MGLLKGKDEKAQEKALKRIAEADENGWRYIIVRIGSEGVLGAAAWNPDMWQHELNALADLGWRVVTGMSFALVLERDAGTRGDA